MSLKVYNQKRNFKKTPEPAGKKAKGKGPLKFVIQKHAASRMHHDFRLEFGGSLKSWAVPKGPSLNPLDQRLAVHVEDHPMDYGNFEGIIPKGNYGAGTVMIWDEGTYTERNSSHRADSEKAMIEGLKKGHMTFILEGQKLKGEFALIQLKKNKEDRAWLLVKKRDEFSTYKRDSGLSEISVKSGRTMEQIAKQAEKDGDVWYSKRKNQKAVVTLERKPVLKSIAKSPPRTLSLKPGQMPRRVKPMMPVRGAQAPHGEEWIFEKNDEGLRAIAEIERGRAHLYSKSFLPFDKKFPEIIDDLRRLSGDLLLDGKVVTHKKKSQFVVSDVLYAEGQDLREKPLKERLNVLQKNVSAGKTVAVAQTVKQITDGESYVAKKLDSPYQSGVSSSWLEVKGKGAISKGVKGMAALMEEARLTHLDKIFFPEDGLTKGDVINYYKSVSTFILQHLKDRPESLNRHPNGINKPGFYQKDMTGYHPKWFKTIRIYSESSEKSIDYPLVQDERSLLYIANLGCIELHPWFSRIQELENPDFLVIDLDPDDNPFTEVVKVAQDVHKVLDDIGAENYVKTSGATGIHIAVPLAAKYDFDQARVFAEEVCKIVQRKHPSITSVERTPAKRRRKIYLDFMQNRRGQTLAAPFCLRPRPGAPVSMPLKWSEVTAKLRPEQFNIHNALRRIEKVGDLWSPVLENSVNLVDCLKRLRRKYSVN